MVMAIIAITVQKKQLSVVLSTWSLNYEDKRVIRTLAHFTASYLVDGDLLLDGLEYINHNA